YARRLRGALRPMTRDARLSALHRGGWDARAESVRGVIDLTYDSELGVGPSSGLCDRFHAVGDLGIEHVGVARRRRDRGVIERALYQFQVAGLAQKLGAEVMTEVMKAEVRDTRALAQITPMTLQSVIRDRIALAAHAIASRPRRHE